MTLRAVALGAGLLVGLVCHPAMADPVVQIASRGQNIPAVLLTPDGPIKAAVILLAGGNGRLDIADGKIHKLRFNQLVRTRAQYRDAGYLTLVPDLAADMKAGESGVAQRYRASPEHALDVGAMVAFLKARGAARVIAIGTSRGTLAAANAVERLGGQPSLRPDAQVLTSGFWKLGSGVEGFSIWKMAHGRAQGLRIPTLIVRHLADACAHTPPAAVPAFADWLRGGGAAVTARDFTGGLAPAGPPCDARAPHGFYGLDAEVVKVTTDWMGKGG